MSGCYCERPTEYRVTGEVVEVPPDSRRAPKGAVGTGEKTARIRCANCGGKVSFVGSDLLVELGIDIEDIHNGRCLSEEEQVTLTIDLY